MSDHLAFAAAVAIQIQRRLRFLHACMVTVLEEVADMGDVPGAADQEEHEQYWEDWVQLMGYFIGHWLEWLICAAWLACARVYLRIQGLGPQQGR
ncbi:hypothetical protein N0V95_005479 [Ascochyta clinopodiicola]|nr:hypothetical protein N0V95_005479 [Ascochyta clinopodiicola]